MGYRFHRLGDKRIERLEVEYYWTASHQSYFSAGDEAEPYCGECGEGLQEGWKFCPDCGGKLVTIFNDDLGTPYKSEGV